MEAKPLLTPDYFYDRSQRCWTLLWNDQNKNQVGAAEYFAGQDGKKRMLDWIKRVQPTMIDHSTKIDPESFGKPVVFVINKQY